MNLTIGQNIGLINGAHYAWHCLLALSRHGAVARRLRCTSDSVVIEVETPFIGEPKINGNYASVQFYGCTVVWKIEDGKNGNQD